MDKNTLKAFALSLAVTPLAAALYVTRGLDALESRSVDYRFAARGPVAVSNNVAIVTAKETAARLAPADRASVAEPLPAGSRVRVLSERGDWIYCALPGGGRGWIPETQIERVRLAKS